MRFILSTVDCSDYEKPKSIVGSYDTIREAREIAREEGYNYYIIYDTIESRTLIQYGEQESD